MVSLFLLQIGRAELCTMACKGCFIPWRTCLDMRSYPALAVAAVLALTLSIAAHTAPSAQQNMRQHRTRPKPTNHQVLPKDISARDLIATIHGYETELGVECSFCHARNPQTNRMDFASDANPHKSTARVMI